ncbi:unnamed protein product [Arabis nemorensis]|uniref:Uncharacterized protein n=1 Tax=Arabis nemorensis TaxID=586526 RepID=A0A565AXK7_9BRAS|nr:unnamed protein product [Arabis nemorensis]
MAYGFDSPEPFVIFPNESLDIERFSDSLKPKKRTNKSGFFYDYLLLRPDNFPKQLLGDGQRERPAKRAKWSMDADLKKLDVFEKLEAKLKAEGKEENEEEGEDEVEELDGEQSDNGDYDQTLMMTTMIITRHPMAILKMCIKKLLLPRRIKFCRQEKLVLGMS